MLGWRGSLGYIAPSTGERAIPEFYQFAPEGVAMLVTALTIHELTEEQMDRAVAQVEDKARHLAATGANALFFAGAPPVIVRPGRYDKEIIARMEAASGGLPSTTDLTVALEAFQHLGITRMVVATPFQESMNALLRRFLEGAGCKIVAMRGLGKLRNVEIAALPDYAPYQLASELVKEAPEADGIYIPCGRWGNPRVFEQVERDLHRPVVTANQITIWWALKTLGIAGPFNGYGRLLQTL